MWPHSEPIRLHRSTPPETRTAAPFPPADRSLCLVVDKPRAAVARCARSGRHRKHAPSHAIAPTTGGTAGAVLRGAGRDTRSGTGQAAAGRSGGGQGGIKGAERGAQEPVRPWTSEAGRPALKIKGGAIRAPAAGLPGSTQVPAPRATRSARASPRLTPGANRPSEPQPAALWRSRSSRQHWACRQVSDHQPKSPRLYANPSGDTSPRRLSVQPRHSGRRAPRSPKRNSRRSFTADHGTRCVPRSHARTADSEHPSRSAHALRLNQHDRRSSRNPSGGRCHTRRGGTL